MHCRENKGGFLTAASMFAGDWSLGEESIEITEMRIVSTLWTGDHLSFALSYPYLSSPGSCKIEMQTVPSGYTEHIHPFKRHMRARQDQRQSGGEKKKKWMAWNSEGGSEKRWSYHWGDTSRRRTSSWGASGGNPWGRSVWPWTVLPRYNNKRDQASIEKIVNQINKKTNKTKKNIHQKQKEKKKGKKEKKERKKGTEAVGFQKRRSQSQNPPLSQKTIRKREKKKKRKERKREIS